MKKIILMFLITLVTLNLSAQKVDMLLLITKILDSSNGVITASKTVNNTQLITAELPRYISFSSFHSSCKFIFLEYDNVVLEEPWTIDPDDFIIAMYSINKQELTIVYDDRNRSVGFSYERNDKNKN